MSKDGFTALKEQLRAAPPRGLARLADEDMHHLARAIADARHRDAAELEAAGEQAFRLVPWFLRGPIKKIVGG